MELTKENIGHLMLFLGLKSRQRLLNVISFAVIVDDQVARSKSSHLSIYHKHLLFSYIGYFQEP